MNNKLKIIGTVLTIATFTAGGVVGGTILANQNTAQQVAEAEDKGYQEGHKDGYEQGASENTGYTEEDLENAKDEGREEAENEYLTVLSILTSQEKIENWATKDICLYSTMSNSTPGLIAYKKSENKFYKLFDSGCDYRFLGIMDGEILICSGNSSTPGLFGLTENMVLKTYMDSGYGFENIEKTDGKMIVSCRGLKTGSNAMSLVEVKDNQQYEILLQSDTDNDIQIIGSAFYAYEAGTSNLYIWNNETNKYEKIEDIDVTINSAEYIAGINIGKSILLLRNSQNKLAFVDTATRQYTSKTLYSGEIENVLVYNDGETDETIFYTTKTELWQYSITYGSNSVLVQDIQDFRMLMTTQDALYFYCQNSAGTYDLYGLKFGQEATKHVEGCTEMYDNEFGADYVGVYAVKDGEPHQYKLYYATNTIEQVS